MTADRGRSGAGLRWDFLLHEPFSGVREWAEESLGVEEIRVLDEHVQPIRYHLGMAFGALHDAQMACPHLSSWGSNFSWSLTRDDRIYVMQSDLNLDPIVWFGDVAIRAAASAIDVALGLLNHVLGLGVPKKYVRWSSPAAPLSKEAPLRRALRQLPDGQGLPLMTAIDRVFSSIGYELLSGYRHWVTHRGAPAVRVAVTEQSWGSLVFDFPLEIFNVPVDFPEGTQRQMVFSELDWRLSAMVRSRVFVRCWRFYPGFSHVLPGVVVDEATEDISIGSFVTIEKGAKNIVVGDIPVTAGEPIDDAQEYRARNPPPQYPSLEVAGEPLVEYQLDDYVKAVQRAALFVDDCLSNEWGDWDGLLTDLAARRTASASGG